MIRKFINNFRVNRVVGYFIIADLILFGGWGLISPIFSIFVIEKLIDATLVNIGIGAAMYWMIKSCVQLPLGRFLDNKRDESLSLYVLFSGLLLTSFSAFSFTFMTKVWHLYAVQSLHGLGMAFYVVSWYGIFSRHLDKNKVAFEWAMNSSSLGFASGIMAFAGGYIANNFGFVYVFGAAGILSAIAAMIIFMVPNLVITNKVHEIKTMKDHTPKTVSN